MLLKAFRKNYARQLFLNTIRPFAAGGHHPKDSHNEHPVEKAHGDGHADHHEGDGHGHGHGHGDHGHGHGDHGHHEILDYPARVKLVREKYEKLGIVRDFGAPEEPQISNEELLKEQEKLNDIYEKRVQDDKIISSIIEKHQLQEGVRNEDRYNVLQEISKTKEGDHEEVEWVKSKILELINNELEFQAFTQKLKEEEKKELTELIYSDAARHSSYYFNYNADKAKQNIKIVDPKAPGNPHHKPSIMLEHEHVDPSHYLHTEELTPDKLLEIYAYYTYVVDAHISQIRPGQLNEVQYIRKGHNTTQTINSGYETYDNLYFEYYHRFREVPRDWISQTQEINFDLEKAALPRTSHYHHQRGVETDVEWTEEQKYPHVASRKGYPILSEDPLERLLGFERAPAHPGFQIQAFVQTPSFDPDASLSFEKGETIYENKRVSEWIRLWKLVLGITLPFWPAFYTFEIYAADGAPSLQWLSEAGNWHEIPRQFQDMGDWNLEEARYPDDRDYMNIQYTWKRLVARPSHAFYQISVLAFLHLLSSDYVTKMVYNKDKDLVFVYRLDGFFTETEYVYEVHHLEQMVPYAVSAYKDLSAQQHDGIMTVHCMDTKDYLKFYNEDKYWNLDLKKEFYKDTGNLWRNLTDRYQGHIFNTGGAASIEDSLMQFKVQTELREAIKKHGPVQAPETYESTFEKAILEKRNKITEDQIGKYRNTQVQEQK